MALSTTIKSIQDGLRKDVGVDGDAKGIGQLPRRRPPSGITKFNP